jgi:D-alanine-D-alanine ligase-like ATP-grasp enzyme
LHGTEYRIIVVRGRIILGLKRNPLSVVGDGESTVRELTKDRLRKLRKSGRKIRARANSARIASQLRRQGLTFTSIPADNQHVILLANKNLSDGASAIECTSEIAGEYAELARKIYAAGFAYTGADIIKGDNAGQTHVIELNGRPGYSHFIKSAPHHPRLVKNVFIAVFRAAHQEALEARKSKQLADFSSPDQPRPTAENDNSMLGTLKIA